MSPTIFSFPFPCFVLFLIILDTSEVNVGLLHYAGPLEDTETFYCREPKVCCLFPWSGPFLSPLPHSSSDVLSCVSFKLWDIVSSKRCSDIPFTHCVHSCHGCCGPLFPRRDGAHRSLEFSAAEILCKRSVLMFHHGGQRFTRPRPSLRICWQEMVAGGREACSLVV